MQQFDTYSFSDFLDDLSFIRFVKHGSQNDGGWQEWVAGDPPNLEDFNKAKAFVLSAASIRALQDTGQEQDAVWEKINARIAQDNKVKAFKRIVKIWTSAAAAVLLIGAAFYWYATSQIVIQTAFGEQRTVILPDNSTIKLNANSGLHYYRAWAFHGTREVWLNGEAYFKVEHLNKDTRNIKPAERFVAHAGSLNVQVLGTEFNIKNRRDVVIVSLIKGRVGVSAPTQTQLILRPGEAVNYQRDKVTRTAVSEMTNQPLAWTKNRMIVSGITVAGIIENFEDTYGARIVIENPALGAKRIDGTISMMSKEATLYMLANLLNGNVEQRGSNTYYIKLNHPK